MRGERSAAKRRKFIRALDEGFPVTEAEKIAGLARRTVYKWVERGDTELSQIMADAAKRNRTQVLNFEEVTPQMWSAFRQKSLSLLSAIVDNPRMPALTRVKAAKILLDSVAKWEYTQMLLKRIDQVDRANEPPSQLETPADRPGLPDHTILEDQQMVEKWRNIK